MGGLFEVLIGGVISYVRRKEEIGGWLLFFYIQLYVGLAASLLILPFFIGDFLPGKWGGVTARYVAFLSIAVSALVIYVTQFVVAHKLRRSRDGAYLRPLRRVLALNLVVSIAVLLVDIKYDSIGIFSAAFMVLWAAVWLPYFHRSIRVGHVFVTRDWSRVAEHLVD
jgi:hypothetical protein